MTSIFVFSKKGKTSSTWVTNPSTTVLILSTRRLQLFIRECWTSKRRWINDMIPCHNCWHLLTQSKSGTPWGSSKKLYAKQQLATPNLQGVIINSQSSYHSCHPRCMTWSCKRKDRTRISIRIRGRTLIISSPRRRWNSRLSGQTRMTSACHCCNDVQLTIRSQTFLTKQETSLII